MNDAAGECQNLGIVEVSGHKVLVPTDSSGKPCFKAKVRLVFFRGITIPWLRLDMVGVGWGCGSFWKFEYVWMLLHAMTSYCLTTLSGRYSLHAGGAENIPGIHLVWCFEWLQGGVCDTFQLERWAWKCCRPRGWKNLLRRWTALIFEDCVKVEMLLVISEYLQLLFIAVYYFFNKMCIGHGSEISPR